MSENMYEIIEVIKYVLKTIMTDLDKIMI